MNTDLRKKKKMVDKAALSWLIMEFLEKLWKM